MAQLSDGAKVDRCAGIYKTTGKNQAHYVLNPQRCHKIASKHAQMYPCVYIYCLHGLVGMIARMELATNFR